MIEDFSLTDLKDELAALTDQSAYARMLVAQAVSEPLQLLTHDPTLKR